MPSAYSSRRLLMIAMAIVGIVVACYFLLTRNDKEEAFLEKQLCLAGYPVFQSDSSSVSTVLVAMIDSDSLKRKFAWPQEALPAGGLPEGEKLRFTFFESPRGSAWPLELFRIEGDSGQLFDGSVCLVHRETMHRTHVKLLQPSELVSPSPAAEEMMFPHSGVLLALQGAEVSEMPAWVCDSCHRERDRWLDKARQTASAMK